MFFSLFWQREATKRDHVARSGQNKSDSSKLCCGTHFAQTVLALPEGTVFQSSHLLPSFDFVELAHARHSPSKLGSALA